MGGANLTQHSLHITQANIQDLDDLAILFNQYRLFYGQENNLEGAHQFLFERFEHMESVIFVAREDKANGKTIGFAQLYPVFSSVSMQRSWILNDLFVNEANRGQGVGRKLLDAVTDYAISTHAKGIALTTAITNLNAQKLYEKNGFVKDEQFYHYYKKC